MKINKKVHMVAHTHWDREWYFTIEDSNILLAENLKHVMDVLEKDPDFPSYCFDAQASVIEEFLKIFPKEKDRVEKLIGSGRLIVGPWYTQTDTLLVNKESIIRNLLYGVSICEGFGKTMKVGYLPDTFGQNSYLPSIFKGFGIDFSIFKRGVYTDQLKENLNFNWRSPDGESVKTNYMVLGYSPGEYIDSSDKYISEHFIPMLKKAERLNKDSDHLLFLVGGDQNLIKENLSTIVKEINDKVDGYELVFSGLEEFMKETFEKDFENSIEGELRATESQRVHRTIGSMRYDIKKINSDVENKILNILEPLYVMGERVGLDYPQAWIDSVWKMMFDAHAHDSIGGCNSDSTNEEVVNRLKKCQRIVDGLINIVKKRITFAISNGLQRENIIVAFNCDIKEREELSNIVIFTKKADIKIREISGEEVRSEIVSQKYISGGRKIVLTDDGDKEFEIPGYYRSELLIDQKIHSLGWKTLIVSEGEEGSRSQVSNDTFISNDEIKLSIIDGKVNIERAGEVIEDALYFEDCGDYGDSYDFSPLAGDIPVKIEEANLLSIDKGELSETLNLSHKILLPKDLEERKEKKSSKELVIFTTLELRRGEKFIRVKHKVDNCIKDHRLRMILRTGLEGLKESYADSGFSLISHEVVSKKMKDWRKFGYVEAPVPIYNMENIAFVNGNKSLTGVITKGLKEYEVLEGGSLALTLYRGVGLLGRDNLEWRPNRASGINNTTVYTPEGQILGDLKFEYAIYLDREFDVQKVYSNVESYLGRSVFYQKQELNTFEERLERFSISNLDSVSPESMSLINSSNDNIYMSCCKKSHNGDGIIIRLYNPGDKDEVTNITSDTPVKIEESDLNESKGKMVNEIPVPSKSYRTLRVTPTGETF